MIKISGAGKGFGSLGGRKARICWGFWLENKSLSGVTRLAGAVSWGQSDASHLEKALQNRTAKL